PSEPSRFRAPTRRLGNDGPGIATTTLAGRRRDQLTKAPDYGAVLVAITDAQFYLSGMFARRFRELVGQWRGSYSGGWPEASGEPLNSGADGCAHKGPLLSPSK